MVWRSDTTRAVWFTLRGVLATIGLVACGGAPSPMGTTDQSKSAPHVALLQQSWTLVSLEEAGGAPVTAPEGRFVADFGPDGDLHIQTDCNVCSAGYTAGADGTLEVVGPVPCTRAWCPSAPFGGRFLTLLESAHRWSVDGDTLELSSLRGVLLLRPSS